jgi:hypothetical protein
VTSENVASYLSDVSAYQVGMWIEVEFGVLDPAKVRGLRVQIENET